MNLHDHVASVGAALAHINVSINYRRGTVLIRNEQADTEHLLTGDDLTTFTDELEALEMKCPECLAVDACRTVAEPYVGVVV